MHSRLPENVKPIWLRPVALSAVALLHAGVVIGAPWPSSSDLAVSAPLTIQVVPQGQTATAVAAPSQAQVAEVTVVEATASDAQISEAKAESEPEAQEPLRTEKVVRAVEPTFEAVTAETQEVTEKPKPKKRAERHKDDDRKETQKSSEARARSRASAVSQSYASAVAGAAASANYRSIVAAELNRRKFYPAAARSSGAYGVVIVTFTVGSGGHVTHHSITRSSGQPVLDQAVRQMMAAVSLPPPPGGVFRASVPIRFDLTR